MTRKSTIKNALFSRRKFRTAALALPERLKGFFKHDAARFDQNNSNCQRHRLSNLEPVYRRLA